MGASDAAEIILKIGGFIFTKIMENKDGPEWMKYAQMGIAFAPKAINMLKDITGNPAKYDTMTPEAIFTTLTAMSIEDVEEQAKRELGLG